MGLLNVSTLNTALDQYDLPVEGAVRYVYANDSDRLSPLFKDEGLTLSQPNPMRADATGSFGLCYLLEGLYRVEICDPDGNVLTSGEDILIGAPPPLAIARSMTTMPDLLSDGLFSYTADPARFTVAAGTLVRVEKGNYVLEVAPESASDHDLSTPNGIKFYLQTAQRDFADMTALLADAETWYPAGFRLRALDETVTVKVAPISATDHVLTTAGGTKLYLCSSELAFDTAAAVQSSAATWYPEGFHLRAVNENFVYEVAATGATDHDITTAGGVKLYLASIEGPIINTGTANEATFTSVDAVLNDISSAYSNGFQLRAVAENVRFIVADPGASNHDLTTLGGVKLYLTRSDIVKADVDALLADTATWYPEDLILNARQEGTRYQVAASSASDHDLTTAGGIKLYVLASSEGTYLASAFGIKGDGSTDNSAAYAIALKRIEAAGGGTLRFGIGVFYGTINLTVPTNQVRRVSIEGQWGGTFLNAARDGEFAVILDNNTYPAEPFYVPMIKNLAFRGKGASVQRRRCGLYAPRRVSLENVGFANCLIGFVCSDNYYGGYHHINFSSCDVGMLQSTLGVNDAAITDLQDVQGTAQTVTLPYTANNGSGHPSNKQIVTGRFNSCRIGWVFMGHGSAGAPHMLASKTTFEGNQIGLLLDRAGLRLDAPWFESNGNDGQTQDFNGSTYDEGSIVMVNSGDGIDTAASTAKGTSLHVHNGRIETVHVGAGCQLYLDDEVSPVQEDWTVADGGGIFCGHVAQQGARAFMIKRPHPVPGALACFLPHHTQRVYGAQPHDGRVVATDDLTGPALASGFSFPGAAGTPTFEVSGGLFPEQKCLQIDTENGDGLRVEFVGGVTKGFYYLLLLGILSPYEADFTFVGSTQTFGRCPPVPANRWVTLGMCRKFDSDSHASLNNARFEWGKYTELPTGAHAILHSGISLLEFKNLPAMQSYCERSDFYMTAG